MKDSEKFKKIIRRRKQVVGTFLFLCTFLIMLGTKSLKEYIESGYTMDIKAIIAKNKLDVGVFGIAKKNHFFYITKNNVRLYNEEGNYEWESIHSIENFNKESKGGYLMLYEFGTKKEVLVYNKKGRAYTIIPKGNINKIKMNKNGYVVIVTNNKDSYNTSVFNNEGINIFEKKEFNSKMILLDIDISPSNNILAISQLDLNYIKPQTELTFQHIKEQESEGIFSGVSRNNSIISKIKFIGNSLYVMTTDKLEKYDVTTNRVLLDFEIEIPNYVKALEIINNENIAILYGNAKLNRTGFNENTLVLYSKTGEVMTKIKLDTKVDFMSSGIGKIIIGVNNEVISYNTIGTQMWKFKNDNVVKDYLELNKDNGLVIDGNKATIIEKKKIKDANKKGWT